MSLSTSSAPQAPWRRHAKRATDLLLVAVAAPVWLVLAGAVAILVRVTLGKPVFYRQRRIGLGERPFEILKFRTMRISVHANGRDRPDVERLTSLGRALRRTSLDELPELLNVLRGEMSLVGPRPLLPRYQPYYTRRERLRFTVPPGLTGLAQLRGRNAASWADRLAADVQYVERWSLWLDLSILCETIWAVMIARGAAADPAALMLDFDEERTLAAEGKETEGT